MAACVFCAIASGDVPAQVVLDEDDFVAFLDARPVFKGHVLLVPREHVVTLPDLPAALSGSPPRWWRVSVRRAPSWR